MLENIKILLGLDSDKYDKLILYQIDKVTKKVLSYCNIKELNPVLGGLVEEKVYNAMRNKTSGSIATDNNNNIKSITRGDTRIEYNVGEAKIGVLEATDFDTSDIKVLNQFRRLRK